MLDNIVIIDVACPDKGKSITYYYPMQYNINISSLAKLNNYY